MSGLSSVTPLRRAQSSSACVEAHLENCRASTSILRVRFASHARTILFFPSYEEPTVDALAPRTDEGRE